MAMVEPDLIPSFCTRGFPEYPATSTALYRPLPPITAFYRPLYITRQIRPAASSVMYSDPSGPTASPTGRCCGPAPSSCQKPSANVSYAPPPAGAPSLNGTNTTRKPACGSGARFHDPWNAMNAPP